MMVHCSGTQPQSVRRLSRFCQRIHEEAPNSSQPDGAADEKPPRQQSVLLRAVDVDATRSRDDEKPVSGCNGVTDRGLVRRRQAFENFFANRRVTSGRSTPCRVGD
jgi:hypothetical protein